MTEVQKLRDCLEETTLRLEEAIDALSKLPEHALGKAGDECGEWFIKHEMICHCTNAVLDAKRVLKEYM